MLEDFRLKVFMTVADRRSFTKAAAELGISQPAVSQNIAELEKAAGARLFDRLRGEVAITPQGEIFHAHAEKILASYESLNNLFCNPRIAGRPASTPLRLFVSPLLESLILKDMDTCLKTLQPSLNVQIVESADNAHVHILALTEKKDADLNIKVSVHSEDRLLQAFFRQLVDYLI